MYLELNEEQKKFLKEVTFREDWFIYEDEIKMVQSNLNILNLNDEELIEIRNSVVWFVSELIDKAQNNKEHTLFKKYLITLSAVTACIDKRKIELGLPV